MPPIQQLSFRVLFYYSAYSTAAEYWKNEGKGWSKIGDKFIGPGSKVKEAVNGMSLPPIRRNRSCARFTRPS